MDKAKHASALDESPSYGGPKGRRHPYKAESLSLALLAIRLGKLSINEAAIKYHIPKSTLRSRIKSNKVLTVKNSGTLSVLSVAQEKVLSDWLHYRHALGAPVGWPELASNATMLLSATASSSVKQPTSGWLLRFKKRHPDVPILRTKRQYWYSPLHFSLQIMDDWLIKLQEHVHSYNSISLCELLKSRCRSLFTLGSLVINKSTDLVPSEKSGSSDILCTALCCFNSFGEYSTPFLIFNQITFPTTSKHQTFFEIFRSQTDGKCEDAFNVWFQNFIRKVDELRIEKPILLLLDRSLARIGISCMKKALDNNVILFCFPLHSEDHQPPNIGVLKHLHSSEQQGLNDAWLSTLVSKWQKHATAANASLAYNKCGLVPLGQRYSKILVPITTPKSSLLLDTKVNKDVIKGMELSLQIVEEKCVEKQYLFLYKDFYVNGASPVNDPIYVVWKELKDGIREAKKSIAADNIVSDISKPYLPVNSSSSTVNIPVCSTDKRTTANSTVGVSTSHVSLRDAAPISDRYRREFNFDAMPALNLEQHALEIVEQYQASIGHVNLQQLVIEDEDFGSNEHT